MSLGNSVMVFGKLIQVYVEVVKMILNDDYCKKTAKDFSHTALLLTVQYFCMK